MKSIYTKSFKSLLAIFFILAIIVTINVNAGSILQSYPKFKAFDSDGNPLSGGKVYTYDPGTTNAKTTYSDYGLTTPNANPIILDSSGEATIYLSEGYTKFVLKTAADVTLWTMDYVGKASSSTTTDLIAAAPVVDARYYGTAGLRATIDAALTAIGSNNRTLYLAPGIWVGVGAADSTLTFPANVNLKLDKGAYLTVANGKTLTVNGTIEAGTWQIFSLTGTGVATLSGPIPVIYPQWWGVTGDGTTDDTTTFQQCLVQGGNKTVMVPKPSVKYKITGNGTLDPASNCRIIGDGYPEIYQATAEYMHFNVTGGKSNIEIAYLKFTGTGNYVGTSSGRAAIHFDRTTGTTPVLNVSVHDNIFDGTQSTCAIGGSLSHSRIWRNYITSTNGEHGIYYGYGINTIIDNNVVIGPGIAAATATGVKLTNVQHCLVKGNVISGWRHSNVNVDNASAADITINANIIKSTLAGGSGYGVVLTDGLKVNVTNNDIYSNDGSGIENRMTYVNIRGNNIHDNGNMGIYIAGQISPTDYTTIDSNYLYNNLNQPLYLRDTDTGLIVTNNTIIKGASGTSTYGIQYTGTCSANGTIANNSIYGFTYNIDLQSKVPNWGNTYSLGSAGTMSLGVYAATLGAGFDYYTFHGNVLLLNAGGGDRNITCGSNFAPGWLVFVRETGGANKLVFDFGGIAVNVLAGKSRIFLYTGTAWVDLAAW